jgi:hypothetical protein
VELMLPKARSPKVVSGGPRGAAPPDSRRSWPGPPIPLRAHGLQLVGRIVGMDRLAARLAGIVAFLLGGLIQRAGLPQLPFQERAGAWLGYRRYW